MNYETEFACDYAVNKLNDLLKKLEKFEENARTKDFDTVVPQLNEIKDDIHALIFDLEN